MRERLAASCAAMAARSARSGRASNVTTPVRRTCLARTPDSSACARQTAVCSARWHRRTPDSVASRAVRPATAVRASSASRPASSCAVVFCSARPSMRDAAHRARATPGWSAPPRRWSRAVLPFPRASRRVRRPAAARDRCVVGTEGALRFPVRKASCAPPRRAAPRTEATSMAACSIHARAMRTALAASVSTAIARRRWGPAHPRRSDAAFLLRVPSPVRRILRAPILLRREWAASSTRLTRSATTSLRGRFSDRTAPARSRPTAGLSPVSPTPEG